ncbi:MAG: succinate dehydrogenase [Nitrospinae bacterium CG11_big_fil_rev_8_21_14_0_20_56_8]|nr:MAG: succinate dehydrogenase [Nitrospinae bacterium CG11_big_fil_rev_8_21_14_0_20_56_8]
MGRLRKDQFHLLLIKTHSLTGLIPVGAFLVFHLAANSLRTVGVWQYKLSIDLINNLPFLIWIEIIFIYIPILFHSLVGVYLSFQGKLNVHRYNYGRNWMYTLQRLSGGVIFAFLVYHMGTTVVPKLLAGKEQFEAAPFLISVMNQEFQTLGGRVIYMVGIMAATFHFANGLWGFCMSWGILVGAAAQRNASLIFILFGLVLTVIGFATVVEFSMNPIEVQATVPESF